MPNYTEQLAKISALHAKVAGDGVCSSLSELHENVCQVIEGPPIKGPGDAAACLSIALITMGCDPDDPTAEEQLIMRARDFLFTLMAA